MRLSPVGRGNVEPAMLGERLIELRNLVALGQVGIEVVFAGKDGAFANLAIDSGCGQHGELDCALVEHRQRARQPEADRADVGVGRRAELRRTAAEGLGPGEQLHVDFEADDRLIFGQDFRRDARGGRHNFPNFSSGQLGLTAAMLTYYHDALGLDWHLGLLRGLVARAES